MKNIIILATTLFFTSGAFAGVSSYQERVDSWGKRNNSSSLSRGFIDDGETPTDDSTVPVGEGLLILSLLAGGYALVNRKKIKSGRFTSATKI